MSNKHMKAFLLHLATGKMQIKTTLQFIFILVRMSVIKKIINAGKKVGGGDRSHTLLVGMQTGPATMGTQLLLKSLPST